MILSKPQAEAVYSAMCALNDVYGRLACDIGCVHIIEREDDIVMVTVMPSSETERYANQYAFAIAYKLF